MAFDLHLTEMYFDGRINNQHELAQKHYNDVIMGTIASQIISLTIVFWTVYLDTDQRTRQSSASLAFVRGIHRRHKWPLTRKMCPFDDVVMKSDTVKPISQIRRDMCLLLIQFISSFAQALTLYVPCFQRVHKHIFTFYVITPHWYDTGT